MKEVYFRGTSFLRTWMILTVLAGIVLGSSVGLRADQKKNKKDVDAENAEKVKRDRLFLYRVAKSAGDCANQICQLVLIR